MRPTNSRRRRPAARPGSRGPARSGPRAARRGDHVLRAADEAGIHREAGVRPVVGDGPRRLDRPPAALGRQGPTARARPMRTPTIPATGRRRPAIACAGDDEGENPLPPALEPDGSGESRPSGATGSGSTADNGRVSSNPRKARARRADPRRTRASPPTIESPAPCGGAPAHPRGRPPRLDGDRRRRHSLGAEGGRPMRTSPRHPEARELSGAARAPRTSTASRSRDAVRPVRPDAAETDESSEDGTARARSTRRPTWRELSISPNDVPVDESLRRSSVRRRRPTNEMP